MAVRKQNVCRRLSLLRTCGTCGKTFLTQADTPWVRQIVKDGRQITTYFCTRDCFRASYKYRGWWDGKADIRREQKEANRDNRERNKRYYEAHREEILAKKRAAYWADPEAARESNRYNHEKRRLKNESNAN